MGLMFDSLFSMSCDEELDPSSTEFRSKSLPTMECEQPNAHQGWSGSTEGSSACPNDDVCMIRLNVPERLEYHPPPPAEMARRDSSPLALRVENLSHLSLRYIKKVIKVQYKLEYLLYYIASHVKFQQWSSGTSLVHISPPRPFLYAPSAY